MENNSKNKCVNNYFKNCQFIDTETKIDNGKLIDS